jgi:hypothetical protein
LRWQLAINTLKVSALAFKREEEKSSLFKCVMSMQLVRHLKREQKHIIL